MSDLKKIIKNNLANLFEEKYFDEMESNFGVDKDSEGKEQEQFDDMETVQDVKKGTIKQEKVPGTTTVDKTRKEAGKDAVSYYKDTAKKMKDFQTPDENQQSQSRIGESLEDTPKVDREDSDAEDAYNAEVHGTGQQGLKYDDEGSEKHKALEDRMDDLHDGDPTYEKLKKAGQDYKDHKYGEDEYHNSPKVRVENSIKMEYKGVNEENIFKANGKLISEEQVLKISEKVPSRVKVDESVFAITDGENYYKLLWEGDSESGEATITNFKNVNQVNESIDKMKALWNFDSKDSISTKKNITESGEDAFKRMFNKLRDSDGLVGEDEK
jgi:hypothetical protein